MTSASGSVTLVGGPFEGRVLVPPPGATSIDIPDGSGRQARYEPVDGAWRFTKLWDVLPVMYDYEPDGEG